MTLYRPTKDLVVALPFTMAYHDAANNRALDASGNGNHMTFADGSTAANFPTKIANRKGYRWADSSDYGQIPIFTYSTTALTVFVTMRIDGSRYGVSNSTIIQHRDASNVGFQIDFTSTNLRWFTGAASGGALNQTAIRKDMFDRLISVAGTYDTATGGRLYFDGQFAAAGAGPVAPVPAANAIFVGQTYLAANRLTNGTIYSIRIYNRALSPLEMQSLHYEIRRKVTDI